MPNVPAHIFRAYDVRGVVPEDLNADVVYTIARAYARMAHDKGVDTVAVARDGRNSGPELQNALIQGLIDSGIHVINVGAMPTPLLYFACYHLETYSGIMLTGSHNPGNYNGMKMMLAGETLSGETIQDLLALCEAGSFIDGKGNLLQTDVIDDYIQIITQQMALTKPLRIGLDCGNGIAGIMAQRLFETLGCEVHALYTEVDGNFPNHHPDPSKPENLKDLITLVKKESLDLGLAFDGDGDRLGVVTQNGDVIWPDRQLILFAQAVLKEQPGATIIYDVKCTQRLPESIVEAGGEPLMCRTGHSFVKKALQETKAPLAGEMSGHIFFYDHWYGFDDALYAGCRLLDILSQERGSATEILSALPDAVNTPEINIPMSDDEKFVFVETLKETTGFDGGKMSTIDGIRVDFKDGFGLIRASNTTPNLVLRFEGHTPESLNRIQDLFMNALKAQGINL